MPLTKIKGRRRWWALIWPDGTLGIDADNQMYLYRSEKAAQEACLGFCEPLPSPIRLIVEAGDGKLYLREREYGD